VITAIVYLGALVLVVILWLMFFRRRRDDAWRQLASEMGAEFTPGGVFRGGKVQAQVKDWKVTLDTYSVPSGDSNSTYTLMTAPLRKKDVFQFTIFRTGLISKSDKALGAQDIDVGDLDFDRDFTIQGNDESKVRALFGNQTIRQMIQAQKSLRLGIRKNELRFEVQGIIKDVERLKSLFALFGEVLTQLEGGDWRWRTLRPTPPQMQKTRGLF
jgi:hypothetical protein